MRTIRVNFENTLGPIKPMHAVNNGPVKTPGDQSRGNFEAYAAAGIPFARNHDASICYDYGGEHTVDVWAIFPDPNADENDPKNYDFTLTDEYTKTILEAGTKVFYRLGNKIEHWKKKYGTLPPPDFHKWARICEHIIRHYNEGWADGFHWDIEYWEIWNEPDLDPDDSPNKRTWGGTKEQFFDLYEIAAKHLKACFPHLQIGGPAIAHDLTWAADFIAEMRRRNVPMDFFSWHIYCAEPSKLVQRQETVRALLDANGYRDTTTNCNEWNYIRNWDTQFIYSLEVTISLKGAAFTAACMLAAQHTTLDMLMYYDARLNSSMNGLFDLYSYRPLKGYYPFLMFNALYRLGTSCEVTTDDSTLYAVAAKGEDGRSAVMLCYYTDEEDMPDKTVQLQLHGGAESYRVQLLDERHDAAAVGTCGAEDTLTLRPNTVLLLTAE